MKTIARTLTISSLTLALGAMSFGQTLEQKVAALEEKVAKLELLVNSVNLTNVQQNARLYDLETKTASMSVSGKTVRFTGVNVQIRKDAGSYWAPNGYGNLIIGYNEVRSDGKPTTRTGSHNLVLGNENSYSGVMGIVGGYRNTMNQRFGALISGELNVLNDDTNTAGFGVILTGTKNHAQGRYNTLVTGESTYSNGKYNAILTGLRNACSNTGSVSPEFNWIGTGIDNRAKVYYNAVLTGNKAWNEAQLSTIATGENMSLKNPWTNLHQFYKH